LDEFGWKKYPDAKELLILCDAGGSDGFRPRLWKYALYQNICKVYGLSIRICHYPLGASKWNPVEHRLFSFISKNWDERCFFVHDILALLWYKATLRGR